MIVLASLLSSQVMEANEALDTMAGWVMETLTNPLKKQTETVTIIGSTMQAWPGSSSQKSSSKKCIS